ncbi:hypothetical protein SUGI_0585070 [Cryptomeria japonica]|nr:hypothetical protein SUGI_0585070 [Cryptomeria japonica]
MAGSYGIASNNKAELKGLHKGMAMWVEKSMEKVIIEGDSQVILNKVSKDFEEDFDADDVEIERQKEERKRQEKFLDET